MTERLQKLLAQAGVASRRHAEEMILAGRVRVNGKVITELGTQVDPALDKVTVDSQPVTLEPKAYYILNKPRGYISDRDDTSNLKTALDLVPDGRRLFAAGRLDLMSEGMLFLTNDGALANRLTHPRYEHEKEYLALVFGNPDDKTIARLEKGILYDGEWMRADVAERAGRNQDVGEAGRDETWLRIILHEGKKRQIRHMCAALGHAIKRLVRVRMGGLKLGNLKVGEWRKLSQDEVALLTKTGGQSEKRARPSERAETSPARRDEGDAGRDEMPRRGARQGGRSSQPLRDAPPRKDSAPRRQGSPRRDEGPRREPPPTRTSFSPGRGGSPRTGGGGAPRRDESPTRKSFAPRRQGPPRRDEGPRREPPPTRTSFSPGRGGSPRTGGGGAPRREGPPRDGRKGNERARGEGSDYRPPHGSKRNAPPPRGPKQDSSSRHKPKDNRRDA
ncbi:MAG: pseudouridine synthase [Anaerolineae bacterium]|nr:pseudouridine synthase [Anaerolineae bacterium]